LNTKKILLRFLILGVFVLVILGYTSSATMARNVIEDARQGVVCVYVENLEGESLGYGSGFVIGTDEPFEHIVTASHVVDPEEYGLPANHTLNVYIRFSRDDRIPASVRLEETGLALLQLSSDDRLYGYEALRLGNSQMVSSGDDVYALGFSEEEVDELGRTDPEDTIVKRGAMNSRDDWNDIEVLYVDPDINRGNTGGPLLDQSGQVVGINNYEIKRDDDINGAVLVNDLIGALDRRNIDYLSGAPLETEEKEGIISGVSDDVLLFGGIGVAVLLVVIIIAVTATNKKKKKAASAQRKVQRKPSSPSQGPSRQTPSPPGTPPAPGGAPPVPGGVPPAPGGVPPVPGSPQSPPPGNMQQTQPQANVQTQPKAASPVEPGKTVAKDSTGTKPVVVGITGYFAGNTLELGQGRMSIGRDPRLSQLVYPQDNEEISRKHCTIFYEDKIGQFGLEDSSSNGTFLSSNERLETGKTYYLKPGDRFYIVDPKETFEVKVD